MLAYKCKQTLIWLQQQVGLSKQNTVKWLGLCPFYQYILWYAVYILIATPAFFLKRKILFIYVLIRLGGKHFHVATHHIFYSYLLFLEKYFHYKKVQ